MLFSRFTQTLCAGILAGCTLAAPVYALADTDSLGLFLAQRFPELVQPQTVYAPPAQSIGQTATLQDQAAYAGATLKAQSALIMNANTGQILYQKNIDSVRSIASISKLMAAMVLLDANLDMNQQVTITEAEIDRLKGTTSRLSVGTTLSRNQLLHLGLMSSENRAIHALARTYPGGLPAFVAAMNNKARSLGMSHTRFFEPTGLDPRNVSTALELGTMVQAAANYPQIRQLSTSNYGQAYTSAGKLQEYKNTNSFVREGQWNIMLQKTGYIRESGRSMVMAAQMGREPVVIVVLGSSTSASRSEDVRILGSIAQAAR